MCRMVVEYLVGPGSLQHYPSLVDDFMAYQDSLEDAIAKSAVLPKWLAKHAVRGGVACM